MEVDICKAQTQVHEKFISKDDFVAIESTLNQRLHPFGFETRPFLISWYNSAVSDKFRFKLYPDDTLAFCVINNGTMFEKGFLPFLFGQIGDGVVKTRDALDESIHFHLQQASNSISQHSPIFFKDSDMVPSSRRPAFFAQPVAHVSGTAFYYHPEHILSEAKEKNISIPWNESENGSSDGGGGVFGVCIHPKYGGWFAIRGLIILQNTRYPHLKYTPSPDVIQSCQDKVKLLHLFNFGNWKDWRFRDIIQVDPQFRYSQLQRKYFEIEPKHRFELLQQELTDAFKFSQQQNL